ncbi:tetratricopeptide repeat protein [Nesterenkonia halophila]
MTQPGPEDPRSADPRAGAAPAGGAEEPRGVDSRGAVDLSALAGGQQGQQSQQSRPSRPTGAAQQPAASSGSQGADSWVIAVQAQQLQQVVQLSSQAPVIVLIHGADDASEQMRTRLEDAVDAQQGRVLMAEIDASSPEIAQAQGADQVPVATAFLGGRPVGEFDASVPAEQLDQLVPQLVQAATQNGMTEPLPPQSSRAAGAAEAEPELPPEHQKAHDALAAGDLDGAVAAYEEALRQKPGDEDATVGLARVKLMQRTQDTDVEQVRRAAADAPDDVNAQTAVADVDVLGGHVEDAFARLVRFIQQHPGEDRETARAHLVELYSIVGDSDPRVNKSRQQLARALF